MPRRLNGHLDHAFVIYVCNFVPLARSSVCKDANIRVIGHGRESQVRRQTVVATARARRGNGWSQGKLLAQRTGERLREWFLLIYWYLENEIAPVELLRRHTNRRRSFAFAVTLLLCFYGKARIMTKQDQVGEASVTDVNLLQSAVGDQHFSHHEPVNY